MRLWIGIAMAAGLALVAQAAAAAEIYVGTIGSAEIVVVLRAPEDGRVGTYFYRRVGADIALHGDAIGPTLVLTEDVEEPVAGDVSRMRTSGTWRLIRAGDGLTGQWQASAGSAPLSVTLRLLSHTATIPPGAYGAPQSEPQPTHITTSGEAAGMLDEMMPYLLERARTPVSQGPERTFGVGAYRMIIDPRTHVYWPRLTRFPDAGAMGRLNTVFEENRAIAIGEAQQCADDLIDQGATIDGRSRSNRRPVADVATIAVTHLGARLISLTTSGSIFCGGAHPSNFFDGVSYEVATAHVFDPSQLLRLNTPARQAAFTRLWRAQMRRNIRANPGRIITECPLVSGEDPAAAVAYRLSEHGLVVTGLDPSGAGAACNQDLADLSLTELAPFLAPGAAAWWQ